MTSANRRTFIAGSAALAAAGVTLRAEALLAADAPYTLPPRLIHPELRAIAAQIEARFKGQGGMTAATLAEARKGMGGNNPFSQPPTADVPWTMRTIPGAKGAPNIAIAVVNAKAGTSRPAILHTHGGGYVAGTAKDSVRDLQIICRELDCVAVSVDYRLAPETTYAGSIEDNYAGLKWLYTNAAELGADRARIAVMGESAGGGHAALLAIAARDRGEVPLAFQCLIYPMLDDRTGSSRPVPQHVGTMIWTPASNRFGWESFLGQKPGGASAPKGAVPARVADLAGLPPAFIGVGTLDLFCDEDVEYARRLNAAAVPAELIVVPGAFHGFDGIAMMTGLPLGKWFQATKLNALRRGFGLTAV